MKTSREVWNKRPEGVKWQSGCGLKWSAGGGGVRSGGKKGMPSRVARDKCGPRELLKRGNRIGEGAVGVRGA